MHQFGEKADVEVRPSPGEETTRRIESLLCDNTLVSSPRRCLLDHPFSV